MSSAAADGRFGLWIVDRELGRGSGGVVHCARHAKDGRIAAIKTATAEDAAMRANLRRELHALARLHHPGIVRVLDEGIDAAEPWYAMELIEGRTLLERARAAWEPPLPGTPSGSRQLDETALGAVLTLVYRLCLPLAHLHGEGIVHRDLKPQNVLVTAEGRVVIVDLGLIARFGAALSREELAAGGAVVGSAAYMAPEQWRGEYVDARADLFALGVMLYVLLTGRAPFATRAAVRDPDVTAAPPSHIVGGIPEGVDDLCLRLLHKRPEGRLGFADDVAASLTALGAEPAHERLEQASPYLYRPAFVGRRTTLARALGSPEQPPRASVLALGGESGMGKTRFLMELALKARAQGATVMVGECAAPGGAPFAPFRPVLQHLADRVRQAGGPPELGRDVAVLAPYEPALQTLPGATEAVPELPLEASRLRLFRALADVLERFAAAAPLWILLDDVQWADELTMGFLRHLAATRRLQGSPARVAIAYRLEECGGELENLVGHEGVERFSLDRLEASEMSQLVGGMLALQPVPDELSRLVARHGEGNPFFVAEYLRTAVTLGMLRRLGGRWNLTATIDAVPRAGLPLPAVLRSLLERRLASLSDTARRVLDVAAVLGREVEGRAVQVVSGLPSHDAMSAVGELVRRQVVEEADADRFRFLHDKIREMAYDGIDGAARRTIHRAAAVALEDIGRASARELARHWEGGDEPERARSFYLVAAREDVRRYALREAEEGYRACLRLHSRPSAETVAVRNELGARALQMSGRNDEALEEHALALEEATALGDGEGEAASLRMKGMVLLGTGRPDRARPIFERALSLYRDRSDRRGEALCMSNLATLCREQGDVKDAAALLGRVLEAARDLRDPRLEGEALDSLGALAWEQGNAAGAAELYDQAITLRRASGERHLEARTLANMASLEHGRGRGREARRLYEQAVGVLHETGDRRSEGIALGNLATVLIQQGEMEEAAALYGRAVVIAREVGDRRHEGRALGNLGTLHHTQGELSLAADLYQRALAIHEDVGDQHLEGITLGNLAELTAQQGRHDEAAALYDRALAIHRRLGDQRAQGLTLVTLGDLRRRQGKDEQARRLFEQALSLARATEDRRHEGYVLCRLAALARQDAGDKDGARARLARAEALLRGVGEPLALLVLRCEQGRWALEAGDRRRARARLAQARALGQRLAAGPGSAADDEVRALEAAIGPASRRKRLL